MEKLCEHAGVADVKLEGRSQRQTIGTITLPVLTDSPGLPQ
ncbi:MAG TPA: hypothetical protein VG206_01610 [Terriglobia bacterium]|nr:hypothetical protein [Terriglobia bacterium]